MDARVEGFVKDLDSIVGEEKQKKEEEGARLQYGDHGVPHEVV